MLCQMAHNFLFFVPDIADLDPPDRATVMEDFRRGREYINFHFQAKLSFWRALPWIIAILAHQDPDTTREGGRQALALADNMDRVEWHPVVEQMMAPGSRARAEYEAFCFQNVPLAELPLLLLLVARFKFISVVERWVEALHALTKKLLKKAPNASAVHVAYMGLQPVLRDRLAAEPMLMHDLSERACTLTTPFACIQASGLSRHPSVKRITDAVATFRDVNRKHRRDLTDILLHVDSHSLHAALPDVPPDDEDDDDDDDDRAHGGFMQTVKSNIIWSLSAFVCFS
jgi:hypothetical protein